MSVTKVVVEDERACGIEVEGQLVRARAVASNAHPATTFLDLLDAIALDEPFVTRVKAWKSVGPSLKVNLALGELPNFSARPGTNPQPHHHATIHIAPSIDYLEKAYADARSGGESEEPLIECFLQTPTDPSLAPPGKQILSIFAQYFPYDRPDGWSSAKREAAADKIVGILARYAPNLPSAIEHRQVLAPPDLEERFGLVGGHIFHGELLPGQIYQDRFATRTPLRNALPLRFRRSPRRLRQRISRQTRRARDPRRSRGNNLTNGSSSHPATLVRWKLRGNPSVSGVIPLGRPYPTAHLPFRSSVKNR